MTNQPTKITLKEKLSLTFFFLFFCIAVVQLFRPDPMDMYNHGKESEKQYAKQLTQKVQLEKKIYQDKFDSLQTVNDSLSQKALLADTQLKQMRSKNASLRVQLQSTIVSYDSDTTLIKDAIAFDSLANLSTVFITQVQEQDSLCQLEISLLKEQMENRDSVILICNAEVKLLEQDFFLLSKSHERQTEQIAFTEKKLKRQSFKKRFYQGAALVVSGICAAFYLTHH